MRVRHVVAVKRSSIVCRSTRLVRFSGTHCVLWAHRNGHSGFVLINSAICNTTSLIMMEQFIEQKRLMGALFYKIH